MTQSRLTAIASVFLAAALHPLGAQTQRNRKIPKGIQHVREV